MGRNDMDISERIIRVDYITTEKDENNMRTTSPCEFVLNKNDIITIKLPGKNQVSFDCTELTRVLLEIKGLYGGTGG
jgi:hypothetical protein